MESHACQTGFQKEVAALSCQSDKFRKMEEPYRREAYQKIRMLLESQKKLLRIKDIPTAAYIIQLSMEAVVHELSFYDSSCDKEKVLKEYVDMIMCYLSPGQNR